MIYIKLNRYNHLYYSYVVDPGERSRIRGPRSDISIGSGDCGVKENLLHKVTNIRAFIMSAFYHLGIERRTIQKPRSGHHFGGLRQFDLWHRATDIRLEWQGRLPRLPLEG